MNNEFNLKSINDLKKFSIEQYELNRRKWIKSRTWFIFLNISSFIMSTTIVILTLFIIEGGVGGNDIKMLFVTISILTSFIALIAGIGSFFQMKSRKAIYIKKIDELKQLNELVKEIDENKIEDESILNIYKELEKINENDYV